MPELPEVETTRRGIEPHIVGKRVTDVVIRYRQLRWPVTPGLAKKLIGQSVRHVWRRGKYLLLETGSGTLLIHLGMSGRLRIVPEDAPVQKHDHVDIIFASSRAMRFTDPRRFGCVLWLTGNPLQHKLLACLGPEPLDKSFDGQYLFSLSRGRKVPVKSLIMDSKVVVGVGNIYANEVLFLTGILPSRPAGSLDQASCDELAINIKQVLEKAILAGGTTLRDFISADGRPGYFQQELMVYGRGAEPCRACESLLQEERVGQRSTVYCPQCQK